MNKIIFSLFISLVISGDCHPFESYEIDQQIRALQNPNLFGGDMLGVNASDSETFNAQPDDNRLWPLATIPFVIDGNLEAQKSLIMLGMDQYHQNTCIRFVQRTDQYDYIHISRENGCYSYVGRIGGIQMVSLGIGCHSIGTIVHELGHAVGFYHEHQRSDRDDYINIYKENMAENMDSQFDKLSPSENRLLVPFDFSSVMLYGPLTFSKDGKSITMGPNDKHKNETMIEVYQKYGLSRNDIIAIDRLYQCSHN